MTGEPFAEPTAFDDEKAGRRMKETPFAVSSPRGDALGARGVCAQCVPGVSFALEPAPGSEHFGPAR